MAYLARQSAVRRNDLTYDLITKDQCLKLTKKKLDRPEAFRDNVALDGFKENKNWLATAIEDMFGEKGVKHLKKGTLYQLLGTGVDSLCFGFVRHIGKGFNKTSANPQSQRPRVSPDIDSEKQVGYFSKTNFFAGVQRF